jgi:hypothetical protein
VTENCCRTKRKVPTRIPSKTNLKISLINGRDVLSHNLQMKAGSFFFLFFSFLFISSQMNPLSQVVYRVEGEPNFQTKTKTKTKLKQRQNNWQKTRRILSEEQRGEWPLLLTLNSSDEEAVSTMSDNLKSFINRLNATVKNPAPALSEVGREQNRLCPARPAFVHLKREKKKKKRRSIKFEILK